MALPDVTETIRDGALGIVPPNSNNTHLKIGVSLLGQVNTIYSVSDPTTAKSLLGNGGPLVEAAALAMATQVATSGPVVGGPIYCVPANPSTYGTVSSVTKIGTGAETLTVAAKNAIQILAKITTGGAVGTSQVAFSFDGGTTYGTPVATAATLMVPGCTLTTLAFTGATAPSFVLGDVWTITTAGAASLTGTGTGTVAVSTASPVDAYNATVTIVAGGALGTATFTYSLDGGNTTSPTLLVPASGTYVIPDTGLVLTFSGTSTAGDYFTFTTSAAAFSTTDLANAMTAILADSRTWAFVHVLGAPATAAGAATLLAALDTQLSAAAGSYRYARGIIEAPWDKVTNTDSANISAFASSSSTRVMAAVAAANVTSPINGRVQPRSVAWLAAARAAKVAPSEDLGRVASGSCAGVVSLVRDEQATPGLDAARFTTARTIIGRNGYYLTNGRLMAPSGSDFSFWQNGRVMDIACTAVRNALLPYLNDSVRVNSSGNILENDARAIEAYVDGQVRSVLTQPGYASDISFSVSRTNNILSTQTLATTLRVTPLGYAKSITVDIGFANPALTIKQAA